MVPLILCNSVNFWWQVPCTENNQYYILWNVIISNQKQNNDSNQQFDRTDAILLSSKHTVYLNLLLIFERFDHQKIQFYFMILWTLNILPNCINVLKHRLGYIFSNCYFFSYSCMARTYNLIDFIDSIFNFFWRSCDSSNSEIWT